MTTRKFEVNLSKIVIVKLNAGNDTNGNPRRLLVVMSPERMLTAIDEGYSGEGVLDEVFGPADGKALRRHIVAEFPTTPGAYRTLKKRFS